jgi:hypothetical protein
VVKTIAAISLIYDVGAGIGFSLFRAPLNALFELPAPTPPIHADLNSIFLTCVGIGYLLPYRDPVRYRAYMWIFGVVLKTAGAAAFVADYVLRDSPPALLLFAAADAAIAALTGVALFRTRVGEVGGVRS